MKCFPSDVTLRVFLQIKRVRHMVRQFQEGSYDEALIHTENEQLSFAYSK